VLVCAQPLREDLPGGVHIRAQQERHVLQEEDQVGIHFRHGDFNPYFLLF
jgi:hypothetical protein